MDQFEAVKREFPNIDICQVKYEGFCANPIGELKRIADHCELSWHPQFEKATRAFHVKNENEKWERDLTDQQRATLEEVLRPYLVKYGYESSEELAFQTPVTLPRNEVGLISS